MVNVVADRLFKLFDAAEDSVTDAVACDVPEPAFDHVQPRTARRDEVDMESLMPLQPALNFRMFVGGVVIDNQMQVQLRRRFCTIFFRNLIHSWWR